MYNLCNKPALRGNKYKNIVKFHHLKLTSCTWNQFLVCDYRLTKSKLFLGL